MIKVTGRGDAPSIPLYFLQELKNIDADFCPFFDQKAKRWLIVRFLPVAEEVPASITKKGYITEYCVSKGRDYTPLDRRTLHALTVITYLKRKIKEIDDYLQELQDADDERLQEGLTGYRLQRREFMKKLYNFEHTETFI